ncbi:hypothetical protein SISNIDRAFT_552476 [Sistotremastrum niveocremeum HHB9708]|uniref:Uncharacterized protein n=2 Tax=Sistotremastraceae TaxID=3402574 RepID=A0A164PG01_9AGAM|nr:hypothetical protein SISNIDRAFT_552476 [Sistotremastrum niveocremeum HHB9708]
MPLCISFLSWISSSKESKTTSSNSSHSPSPYYDPQPSEDMRASRFVSNQPSHYPSFTSAIANSPAARPVAPEQHPPSEPSIRYRNIARQSIEASESFDAVYLKLLEIDEEKLETSFAKPWNSLRLKYVELRRSARTRASDLVWHLRNAQDEIPQWMKDAALSIEDKRVLIGGLVKMMDSERKQCQDLAEEFHELSFQVTAFNSKILHFERKYVDQLDQSKAKAAALKSATRQVVQELHKLGAELSLHQDVSLRTMLLYGCKMLFGSEVPSFLMREILVAEASQAKRLQADRLHQQMRHAEDDLARRNLQSPAVHRVQGELNTLSKDHVEVIVEVLRCFETIWNITINDVRTFENDLSLWKEMSSSIQNPRLRDRSDRTLLGRTEALNSLLLNLEAFATGRDTLSPN